MEYFKSDIFNNGLSYPYIPIYSILSDKKDFNIDDIPKWLKKHTLKNIFVICGGQQTLPFPDERSSRTYGKNFTGIQLTDYRTYKIHRKDNLAATLFNKYKKDSLVVDILDPRFDWGRKPLSTTISVNFIFELLHRILDLAKTDPAIIMIGFSRGATFAITLAKWLECTTENRYVISIDPVIAGWKRESVKRCVRSKGKWVVKFGGYGWDAILRNSFPIIPNPGCTVWNVFQRNSFLASWDPSEYPIGSAVEEAYSLIDDENMTLVSQYDKKCKKHQEMRERHLPAVLRVIQSILETQI